MSSTHQARIRFFPDSPPEVLGESKWEFLLDHPQFQRTSDTPVDLVAGGSLPQTPNDDYFED